MHRTAWMCTVAAAVAAVLAATAAGCSNSSKASNASHTTERAATTSTSTTTTIAPSPPSTVAAPAGATILQPAQPTTGPGGSSLPNADWRVSEGGTGPDAWYVFEPIGPQPKSAPVSIIMHGYYEFAGYDSMYELIRHTVRTGRIVIYPRWQTAIATPCPGPANIEPCVASATNGIKGALAFLRADPTRVRPDLDQTTFFAHSFGAIVTVNLANRWKQLQLPEPRALFLDEPHDGGFVGNDEPALDDSLSGIPASTLIECHVGAEGVDSQPGKADSSCNSLWPKLDHIPVANKSIVLTHRDAHGQPPLSSRHGVCTARRGAADAYDWNFCWKVWDGLQPGAGAGDDWAHTYALADSPEHRNTGAWSDGTPIAPLKIQSTAPIRP